MATSTVELIAKLLNQAENAGTEAEAETFMAKAQELATINSIDLAKARHLTVSKEKTIPVQRTIQMGARGTQGLNTYVSLFLGIARANDVKCDISYDSTWIYAYGFEEDIDVCKAMFSSLLTQMVQASEEYKKTEGWKGEKVWREGYWRYLDTEGRDVARARDAYERVWVPDGYKPMTWRTARLDFQQAYATRIRLRLMAAKMDAEMEAVAKDEDKTSSGTELVLVEKNKAVHSFYKEKSNARGSWGGHYSSTGGSAHRAGDRAGQSASLSGSSPLPGARKELN